MIANRLWNYYSYHKKIKKQRNNTNRKMRTSKEAKKHLDIFEKNKNIIDWFAYFSNYVWDELKFANKEDWSISKVDEREFTNELVREIGKLIKLDKIPLPIRLFHSPNEGVNGSDLEIVVQISKNENIIFPCQAKRLYVENAQKDNLKAKYERFDYKTQKDDLINYANKIHGFPLYLFYNYTENEIKTNYVYPDEKLYGCTLGSAIYLKENPPTAKKFSSFHPPAVPITSIVKFKNILSLNSIWGRIETHNTRVLSDKIIFGDNTWEEFGPPIYHKTRFVTHIDLSKVIEKGNLIGKTNAVFKPKYRIVLTSKPIDRNCRKKNFVV